MTCGCRKGAPDPGCERPGHSNVKPSAASRYDSLPSVPKDRTIAVTVGRWGGVYKMGGVGCWRVCIGFVAITYFRAEFTQVMAAWLDKVGA